MTHKSFRLEYMHPEDGRFMSFRHSMASPATTSEFLRVTKWAMNNGVELRIRPDDAKNAGLTVGEFKQMTEMTQERLTALGKALGL